MRRDKPVSRLLLGMIALALAVLLSTGVFAQGKASWSLLARQASKAYAEGKYEEAGHLYTLLIQSGLEGASVRYDLGNCYLKTGDLGRAILEYRRALKFDPHLAAAQQNLDIARRLLKARVAPWQPSPWEAAVQGLPEGALEWGILLLSLLGNVALAVAMFLRRESLRRILLIAMVAAFLCAGAALALLAYADTVVSGHQAAVVLSPAPVYIGPTAKASPLATLPPGSEVIRVTRAGDWSLVLWGEGRGWTKSSAVEVP
jgi:tetratricopeptide (TPR) repeat protein